MDYFSQSFSRVLAARGVTSKRPRFRVLSDDTVAEIDPRLTLADLIFSRDNLENLFGSFWRYEAQHLLEMIWSHKSIKQIEQHLVKSIGEV